MRSLPSGRGFAGRRSCAVITNAMATSAKKYDDPDDSGADAVRARIAGERVPNTAAPQLYAAHTQATARSRRCRVVRRSSLLLKSSWWLPARRKREGAGLGIGIARIMH